MISAYVRKPRSLPSLISARNLERRSSSSSTVPGCDDANASFSSAFSFARRSRALTFSTLPGAAAAVSSVWVASSSTGTSFSFFVMEFAVPAVVSTRGWWTTAGRTVDSGASRTTASSCAAAASLALLTTGRFAAGGVTAFAALTGSARAAELVEDFFPAADATLAADVFLAEETSWASVTFLVCSLERAPAACFPPVVFAIASPFRLC
ncbi:conserved hypothetical protein [Paraburkholderia ribeironis]|uniref:Uncharacterized protein n=1 Tax=Paraburkholderia ribeironis TaxID=1247936 RepID=A0A1N7SIE6_9BURK|nr:conserved hypothetical protein [Paraburkholderia ribeironis]